MTRTPLTERIKRHAKDGDLWSVSRRYMRKKILERHDSILSLPSLAERLGSAMAESPLTPMLPAGIRNALPEMARHGRPDPALQMNFVGKLRPWSQVPRRVQRDIRAAVILDDFSARAFEFEWNQINLKPGSWRQQFDSHHPDILFVESTWNGADGSWSGGMMRSLLPCLRDIVSHARSQNIPTVFWNKEDPPHYRDFLPVARLFDYVFTTDAERIPAYIGDLGHDRVAVLPFAAQPSMHNPRRPLRGYASRDVAFAGSYFRHKFPERRAQMDLLLGAAVDASSDMTYGLEIFSRFLGLDERYQFPEPLNEHVIGSVDYDRMVSAYHLYKVFLNVNSVVDSPTMCSRRIFELIASGAAVVSTESAAIERFFPATEVSVVSDAATANSMIRALVRNPVLRERMVHRGQRRIWREHTYGHRVDTILQRCGLGDKAKTRPTVSTLVSTNRPGQLDHVLDTVASMNGVEGLQVQLCLLTHGFEVDESFPERAADLGLTNTVLLHEPAETSLGACYNKLVQAASGDVVAKIDDDDLYGPQYLSDQIYALDYSGADVVGKQAHYMWIEASDCTSIVSPEREHKNTQFVAGPTIVTWRSTALATPFADLDKGEDTQFLKDIVDSGGAIYSADRYNFVRVRGSHGHTWNLSDWELLAKSDVVVNGCPRDQIFF